MENGVTSFECILDFFRKPNESAELLDADNEVDELYALCDDPMQIPVKLVDDQFQFADLGAIQDLFVENSGFLVVGAVGMQATGKSSILNILANRLTINGGVFDGPFPTESLKNMLTNSPRTGGIDLYVTQDRIILLDAQPLLSFALTNYHSQSATATRSDRMDVTSGGPNDSLGSTCTLYGPGNWPLDTWPEMSSVQIISFLLNVCHVLVVVTDNLSTAPTQLYSLINRAASLKPTVFTPSVLSHTASTTSYDNFTPSALKCETRRIGNPVPSTKVTKSLSPNSSQGDGEFYHEAESDNDEVDENVGGYVRFKETVTGADSHAASVGPTGVLRSRTHDVVQSLESELGDVVDALNRLKNLTDYSASIIHVYNHAPSSVFLDPVVAQRLRSFQKQLLPMIFPGYRRLASLVDIGPRILSAHVASRVRDPLPRNPRYSEPHGTETDAGNNSDGMPAQNHITCISTSDRSVSSLRGQDDTLAVGSQEPSNTHHNHQQRSSTLPDSDFSQTERVFEKHASETPPASHIEASDDKMTQGSTSVGSQQQDSSHVKPTFVPATAQENSSSDNCASQHVKLDPPPAITDFMSDSVKLSHFPEEADVAAECSDVISAVSAELHCVLTQVPKSPPEQPTSVVHSDDNSSSPNGFASWDGESHNAAMADMTHQVQSVRRRFFSLQRRLDHPRLFLVPTVDVEGNTPVGCPTYSASIKVLQEAILSTPRQHMMPKLTEKKWILYAQKMWETILTSPILADYQNVISM